jgi:predicted DNA-binding transcriptional regulator AlpA
MRKAEQQRPYSPDFVSAATLAYRLDCSERKISDYVKAGFLPKPVSIGNLIRWFWPEIVEYIKFQNGMTLEVAAPDDHRDVDEYTRDIAEAKKRAEKTAGEKAFGRAA